MQLVENACPLWTYGHLRTETSDNIFDLLSFNKFFYPREYIRKRSDKYTTAVFPAE